MYDISSKFSSGYYGTVSKANFKNDASKFYAVKSISKSNLSQKSLKNLICEIQILAKLDHPNIVKYYETYDDDKYFYLVMELCEIKTKSKNDVKIIDFGLARKKVTHNLHSIVGTPGYVAPEVLEGTYDRKCDIWALGVLLYVMLYGKYPFDDDNKAVLFEKIKTKEPRYDRREVSQEAIELMRQMLVKDLEMIPKLKNFKPPNEFIKKILGLLVKEVNSAEVEELNNKFYILDEKKNGVVDIAKYKSHIDPALLSTVNERRNINDDDNLFSDCLLNKCMKDEHVESSSKNGKIDYTSFMAANLIDRNLITKETVRAVFNRFDSDALGYLTIKGFHRALRRTGKQISEKDTEKMLSEAGFENPDYISYEEFMTIVGDFLW